MSTNDNDDSSIESGGVNSARTKAKCHCCKTVLKFDPSWTSESECPHVKNRYSTTPAWAVNI